MDMSLVEDIKQMVQAEKAKHPSDNYQLFIVIIPNEWEAVYVPLEVHILSIDNIVDMCYTDVEKVQLQLME